MNAEIIAVGTELLLGQVVNTDSRDIAELCSEYGIGVYYQTVVGDNPERLKEAVRIGFFRADMLIFSGGLGPTEDDLTKETVAEYLNVPLVLHEPSLKKIEEYFERMGRPMTDSNRKQAYLPEGCIILDNQNGTAPGCIVEKEGKVAILLPGPPKELVPMLKNGVRPYFKEKAAGVIYSRVLRIFGVGESSVEAKVRHLIDGQTNPTVAPYAKEGEVTLRISAMAETEETAKAKIQPVAEEIYRIFGDQIYGEGEDNSLPKVVVHSLKERGETLATAESCTGGLIAETVTDIPGASQVFREGVVTYSNQAKTDYLGVSEESLSRYGAVSEPVAREMAEGLRKKSNATYAVSVTGIAGPDGGTPEKPVGLVYVALSTKTHTKVKELHLSGTRARIRRQTMLQVFDLIRREQI